MNNQLYYLIKDKPKYRQKRHNLIQSLERKNNGSNVILVKREKNVIDYSFLATTLHVALDYWEQMDNGINDESYTLSHFLFQYMMVEVHKLKKIYPVTLTTSSWSF